MAGRLPEGALDRLESRNGEARQQTDHPSVIAALRDDVKQRQSEQRQRPGECRKTWPRGRGEPGGNDAWEKTRNVFDDWSEFEVGPMTMDEQAREAEGDSRRDGPEGHDPPPRRKPPDKQEDGRQ